ncbi:MAG: tetratricopeptide repeat protein [Phycisphaerae bacterium]|nr:tetratricopeptide repeat protein [Phycisphaerae bacterium]
MTRCLLTGVGMLLVVAAGCDSPGPHDTDTRLLSQTRVQVALQLAEAQINEGKFDRARTTLAAHPASDDPRVQLALARIDVEEGCYAPAAARIEALPATTRAMPEYDETMAVAYEGLGRWSDAAEAYERVYRSQPSAARLVAWLDTLVAADRADDARAALERERTRFPGETCVQAAAARLYVHLGDADAAVRELRSASLQEPAPAGLRRQLAEALTLAQEYAAAAEQWQALATDAGNATDRRFYRQQQADCYLATGDYVSATDVYRVMTLTDPGELSAFIGLSTAATAAGNPSEGIAAAERALRISPRSADARLALAYAYAQQDNYTKAVQVMEAAPGGIITDASVREIVARWRSSIATPGK